MAKKAARTILLFLGLTLALLFCSPYIHQITRKDKGRKENPQVEQYTRPHPSRLASKEIQQP